MIKCNICGSNKVVSFNNPCHSCRICSYDICDHCNVFGKYTGPGMPKKRDCCEQCALDWKTCKEDDRCWCNSRWFKMGCVMTILVAVIISIVFVVVDNMDPDFDELLKPYRISVAGAKGREGLVCNQKYLTYLPDSGKTIDAAEMSESVDLSDPDTEKLDR